MSTLSPIVPNEAQRKFNETYISTTEIIEKLGLSRTSLHIARTTGKLPDPICIHGQIYVWERAKITAYLDAWSMILNARRGVSA